MRSWVCFIFVTFSRLQSLKAKPLVAPTWRKRWLRNLVRSLSTRKRAFLSFELIGCWSPDKSFRLEYLLIYGQEWFCGDQAVRREFIELLVWHISIWSLFLTWRTTDFLITPKWLLMAFKCTNETKEDSNWGKQALFLTFAQNRNIIISKASFISYCMQITIIVKAIQSIK